MIQRATKIAPATQSLSMIIARIKKCYIYILIFFNLNKICSCTEFKLALDYSINPYDSKNDEGSIGYAIIPNDHCVDKGFKEIFCYFYY